jgi:hypothetical protein
MSGGHASVWSAVALAPLSDGAERSWKNFSMGFKDVVPMAMGMENGSCAKPWDVTDGGWKSANDEVAGGHEKNTFRAALCTRTVARCDSSATLDELVRRCQIFKFPFAETNGFGFSSIVQE